MSVLTKVFVVLLTVSSIAMSMLVVAAFSQQQNWKASAEDWQAASIAAQAKERAMAANAAIEKQRALDMHQEDLRKINDVNARLAEANAKIGELETATNGARTSLTVEQGNVTKLSDHNKLLQAAINREKEFSTKLATRNSELERGNIDLTDRIKELTVNVEMARAQVRALQQQIAGMDGAVHLEAVDAGEPALLRSGRSGRRLRRRIGRWTREQHRRRLSDELGEEGRWQRGVAAQPGGVGGDHRAHASGLRGVDPAKGKAVRQVQAGASAIRRRRARRAWRRRSPRCC